MNNKAFLSNSGTTVPKYAFNSKEGVNAYDQEKFYSTMNQLGLQGESMLNSHESFIHSKIKYANLQEVLDSKIRLFLSLVSVFEHLSTKEIEEHITLVKDLNTNAGLNAQQYLHATSGSSDNKLNSNELLEFKKYITKICNLLKSKSTMSYQDFGEQLTSHTSSHNSPKSILLYAFLHFIDANGHGIKTLLAAILETTKELNSIIASKDELIGKYNKIYTGVNESIKFKNLEMEEYIRNNKAANNVPTTPIVKQRDAIYYEANKKNKVNEVVKYLQSIFPNIINKNIASQLLFIEKNGNDEEQVKLNTCMVNLQEMVGIQDPKLEAAAIQNQRENNKNIIRLEKDISELIQILGKMLTTDAYAQMVEEILPIQKINSQHNHIREKVTTNVKSLYNILHKISLPKISLPKISFPNFGNSIIERKKILIISLLIIGGSSFLYNKYKKFKESDDYDGFTEELDEKINYGKNRYDDKIKGVYDLPNNINDNLVISNYPDKHYRIYETHPEINDTTSNNKIINRLIEKNKITSDIDPKNFYSMGSKSSRLLYSKILEKHSLSRKEKFILFLILYANDNKEGSSNLEIEKDAKGIPIIGENNPTIRWIALNLGINKYINITTEDQKENDKLKENKKTLIGLKNIEKPEDKIRVAKIEEIESEAIKEVGRYVITEVNERVQKKLTLEQKEEILKAYSKYKNSEKKMEDVNSLLNVLKKLRLRSLFHEFERDRELMIMELEITKIRIENWK